MVAMSSLLRASRPNQTPVGQAGAVVSFVRTLRKPSAGNERKEGGRRGEEKAGVHSELFMNHESG